MNYDLAIIGGGWAGFNAAIRARELGLKVAIVEKEQLGGTCLNRGCIPTKTLIQSAKVYTLIKKSKSFGIETIQAKINFSEIQKRKEQLVVQLRNGLDFMLKGTDIITGEARIISSDMLEIGNIRIEARFILIACGSKPSELKDLKIDGEKIISSDQILQLRQLPQSILIIGGGVIGCEFASLFSTLGCQVSIVELMPQLLPGIDREIAKKLEALFKKKGIKVNTDTDAKTLNLGNYAKVLLSIGRSPNTDNLDLDKLGIKLAKSRIVVDEYLKTAIPNIYAAGDCTAKVMLAHFAAYQGRIAAENLSLPNSPKKADNLNIPNCIFTDPEIAAVGLSEEDARDKFMDITINRFDFLGSGMARILDETEGFIKIISDNKTGCILGASIIGPRATELVGLLALAAQCQLKISQIQEVIMPHPTLSEAIIEALRNKVGKVKVG